MKHRQLCDGGRDTAVRTWTSACASRSLESADSRCSEFELLDGPHFRPPCHTPWGPGSWSHPAPLPRSLGPRVMVPSGPPATLLGAPGHAPSRAVWAGLPAPWAVAGGPQGSQEGAAGPAPCAGAGVHCAPATALTHAQGAQLPPSCSTAGHVSGALTADGAEPQPLSCSECN